MIVVNFAGVGDEEDVEIAVGEQRDTVVGAVVDDDISEVLKFLLGNPVPQLAGKGEVADVDVNA